MNVPVISLFMGIKITMFYDDHMPPHFHVEYNGDKAIVDITDIKVDKGHLPKKQLHIVLAWCAIHQDELMQNWMLAKEHQTLNKIAPLM